MSNKTIREIAEAWKEYKRPYVKQSTMAAYVLILENHVLPEFGDNDSLHEHEVQAFVLKKIERGLSVKSVKDILIVLKMVMKFGVKNEWMNHYEWDINSNNFCHRVRKKGSLVNIDEIEYFNITRMKRKKTIFAKMGLSDDDYYPADFLMFFEEQFIYFIKDVEVDKKNKKIRKIGSHYSFFQISNIQFEEDIDNQTIVRIEMINLEQNSYFSKEFFIDSSIVPKLTQYISFYFKALGLETGQQA